MTFTWHWFIKETHKQEELARMVSDLAINHVVTGLIPSDGGLGVLNIAAGYGRCEGWRVVTAAGETLDMSGYANDTYYVYIVQTYDGNGKVNAETITAYTSVQTDTNRIYLAEVVILAGVIDILTDRRKLYAFTPDQVLISGAVTLDDWRYAVDLTLIDAADIAKASYPADGVPWAGVDKTGSDLADLAARDHGSCTGLGDHDHTIYPRKASAESITGGWTITTSTLLVDQTSIQFNSTGGSKGRFIAYDNEFRLWLYGNDFYIMDQNDNWAWINIETAFEGSGEEGGVRPTTSQKGRIGTSTKTWFSMASCAFADICSEILIPKRALQTLDTLMLDEIGAKIRDEPDKHVLKSEKLPGFLRAREWKVKKKGSKEGKFVPGHMRDLGGTVSWLQGCIYELSQDNKKLRERMNTLELAISMLQP